MWGSILSLEKQRGPGRPPLLCGTRAQAAETASHTSKSRGTFLVRGRGWLRAPGWGRRRCGGCRVGVVLLSKHLAPLSTHSRSGRQFGQEVRLQMALADMVALSSHQLDTTSQGLSPRLGPLCSPSRWALPLSPLASEAQVLLPWGLPNVLSPQPKGQGGFLCSSSAMQGCGSGGLGPGPLHIHFSRNPSVAATARPGRLGLPDWG